MRRILVVTLLGMLGVGCVGSAVAQSADGAYRLLGNSIRVDRQSHWQNWELQNDRVSALKVPIVDSGLFTINAQGMKPIFFRRKINVAHDSPDFAYLDLVRAEGAEVNGGATGLSNEGVARFLIDDDLSTYWEPDTPESYTARLDDPGDFTVNGLREWEVEVDLGRGVWVDSLTVIMPSGQASDEFLGDPVKSFAFFISMGERFPFPLGTRIDFSLIGQVTTNQSGDDAADALVSSVRPVDDTGRYIQVTFRPDPLDRADFDLDGRPDIDGSLIQYLRLKVTASDLWRAEFLGSGPEGLALYEALAPEQQGALVYQRETQGGFLVELEDDADGLRAEQKYEELGEERRGPILYFRKEVPRISEIKVWGKGDNYALRPEERAGAAYENGGLGTPEVATDGYYDTEWVANTWSPIFVKGTAWYDLGAVFWVDNLYAVMKLSRAAAQGAFRGHDFRLSDGTLLNPINMEQRDDFPQLENGVKWENIVSEGRADNNLPRVRVFHEEFPLRKVRYMQIRDVDLSGLRSGQYGSQGNLAEVQLYGQGYPVSVWAFSPPITLTDDRGNFIRQTLPRISWDGEAIVRQTDPLTGEVVEVAESLDLHPDVRLQIQTRTSDQTDSSFTFFESVNIDGAESQSEITEDAYNQLLFKWEAWFAWERLSSPHASKTDDDGDGFVDEDPIDFEFDADGNIVPIDNDLDGKFNEDGRKLRASSGRPKTDPVRNGELNLVGWSDWSESYAPTNGINQAVVTSPNPRKFLQIRVNIVSENPNKTARINRLQLDLAPPLSLELVGELALLNEPGVERPVRDLNVELIDYRPPRGIDPLKAQKFSYFVRAAGPDPSDLSVANGFDEILIVSPEASALRGVRLGQVMVENTPSLLDEDALITRALDTRFTHYFQREADGGFRDAAGNELALVPTGSDSLYLRLPFSVNSGRLNNNHSILEVQFESQTFREGVAFTSFIRDSQNLDSVFQQVDTADQDATELVNSSTAAPSLMVQGGGLINEVTMARVFTPNGDGINDEMDLSFTLLKVIEERPLEVGIYDLQGQQVGLARPRAIDGTVEAIGDPTVFGQAGLARFTWDGRNSEGNLVPPGIYVVRVKLEADRADKELVRTINIAY
jgi:hypothetical protein